MGKQGTAGTEEVVGRPRARYRGRHLPMVAVVLAAFIATALAYSGMVLFGLEVAHMTPVEAYALAGFLEVSLVAVALMARNAALEARPYGVLLTLTWILSGTSGLFAALHEIAVPNESTPYMVAFRFVPPLVAALMWHLALVGERHLVTGHTLDERRRESRVHQYVTALEMWRDARLDSSGSRRGMRKIREMHRRQRAARDRALKLLTVEDFERRMQVWVERLEAAERHGNRLDTIGASSVKRGVVRGVAAAVVDARVDEAVEAAAEAERAAAARRAEGEPFAETFESALAADAAPEGEADAAERDETVEADDADVTEAPAAEDTDDEQDDADTDEAVAGTSAATSAVIGDDPISRAEPLPETGHTRRVELFDLVRPEERTSPSLAERWARTDPNKASRDAEPAPVTSGAGTPAVDESAEESSEPERRTDGLARARMTQREIANLVSSSRSSAS